MKRQSFFSIDNGVRAVAVLASTLTVLALTLAPTAYAQNADDTVGLERPLPAFEDSLPTDEVQPQAASEPDSWSEERIAPAALDGDKKVPLMLAQSDPLETP